MCTLCYVPDISLLFNELDQIKLKQQLGALCGIVYPPGELSSVSALLGITLHNTSPSPSINLVFPPGESW